MIEFKLSGGVKNNNCDLSLGGPPSRYFSEDLFTSVSQTGKEYRCFYVFNSGKDKLNKVSISIPEDNTTKIGVSLEQEVQVLILDEKPKDGEILLYHNGLTKTIKWSSDIKDVANQIQELGNINCIGKENDCGYDFLVTFKENKFQNLIKIVNNNLNVDCKVCSVVSGKPINQIAPKIKISKNTPYGVKFGNSFRIGSLKSGEFFPVWVQRIIKDTTKVPPSFNFHLTAN